MCGIVGAVAQRDISDILLHSLARLEYRGYDSAGIAVVGDQQTLHRLRVAGRIKALERAMADRQLSGSTGIAHTRWATHGKPSVANAHPHICKEQLALAHNGIIENHTQLKAQLTAHQFNSDTDSEVIVNQIYDCFLNSNDLVQAVADTVSMLQGAWALALISRDHPGRLIATCNGSPLVVGVGGGGHFIASDMFALSAITRQFILLEEGDIADIRHDKLTIYDKRMRHVERPIKLFDSHPQFIDKAGFKHYMLKEIHEQATVVADTMAANQFADHRLKDCGDTIDSSILKQTAAVQIAACGTSYHAGLVARQWLEGVAGIPCQVEIASEFRYRDPCVLPGALFVAVSQSGETADTLAALKKAKELDYLSTLAICNVAESSITREAELIFLTRAGTEISVASTKAFTAQLVALLMLSLAIAKHRDMNAGVQRQIADELASLPGNIGAILRTDQQIASLADQFADKQHVLYLGRGDMLPIAMEGALKLKEISYIHAEAYAGGELKHGPLALVDNKMPVIALAPGNRFLEKIKSNLQEVRARGGKLYVITDTDIGVEPGDDIVILKLPASGQYTAPILYTLPLQMLAYHIAALKGGDIDQPRNLAKSVTVE